MTDKNQIDKAASLIEKAKRSGADAADAVIVRAHSTSVSVRFGKVESTEASESDNFTLRVFVGKKVASVSANLATFPQELAERAVAMAKASPDSLFEGLADKEYLATHPKDLDLFDNFVPNSHFLTEDALKMEAAALSVKGVSNSGGAATAYGCSGFVLVTSDGFCGAYRSSFFSRSCSALAGEGTAMERDYDYTTALHFSDLEAAEIVGRNAGLGAVRRLGAVRAATGGVDVIFDPRTARGIAGHIAHMVNGASVARKTSLLQNFLGKAVMKPYVNVTDQPLRLRGNSSRPFDGEGVEGQTLHIIENGILQNWLLSSSSARELGLKTNGHGVRSASSVQPARTNFAIEPGLVSPHDMIKDLQSGFYVTELFGHGVDFVTGQYSRGASGFWIENGEITYPVSEVTLGSNLLHMLAHLTPASDIDRRYGTAAPTLLIEGMTLAGK
ncbi:modulator protein [Bartonella henselae]|uniref:PmbA protein n=1 Tax=Bartonella henselae TaxID=38323 RepID=X5M390_BARHN|nr:TldD/PmbA family protein [Bartonella henselae]MDM9996160.1 TldD/PmbA family protein [Bartonella henselae]OLL48039.1 modulator protein [Bartonella henselae]OLL48262.1 modulator protein [Bartonella henselae]OLL51846.1 modulator protein [Bartonella henselae]OLL57555.1 modulator protein [Bartonella henselae]